VISKVGWGEANSVRGRNMDREKESKVWGEEITFRGSKIRVINYWSPFLYSGGFLFLFFMCLN
jgi:hypothetical protein